MTLPFFKPLFSLVVSCSFFVFLKIGVEEKIAMTAKHVSGRRRVVSCGWGDKCRFRRPFY